ncbi:hypothetical protein V2A60_000395 [Cordyceps javanica]
MTFPLVILVWCLEESPRWPFCNGHRDQALAVLARHHEDGKVTGFVRAEFWEMNEALLAKEELQKITINALTSSPANRKRLAILVTLASFGQWSGNGLVSCYLTKILSSVVITNQRDQTLLNGVVSTVYYVTAIFTAGLSTAIGRRQMFVGGAIAVFITFSGLTASIAVYDKTGSIASSKSTIACIFIDYNSLNICLNLLLFLYPTEILPYHMHAMGLSILVLAT